MRPKPVRIILVAIAIITAASFAAPAAKAYSIYGDASTSQESGQPATTSFDFGSAWHELSTPFQSFFNNLSNVRPSDLPSQFVNPSTQIQSMMPRGVAGTEQNIFTASLNFLSMINGWLIGLSDRFVVWVISMIKVR
jgi:hypothetical protein